MMPFTPRKFLTFPIEKQHKKCAELIRQFVDNRNDKLLQHYNEIQQWMGGSKLLHSTFEALSNSYHDHLKKASICLSEHQLLPKIQHGDTQTPKEKTLPIAIYLDSIRSAFNVGSILRTVEAFALSTVYFSEDTPFVTHPQVQKTSMGTFDKITAKKTDNLTPLPRPLIALETGSGAIPFNDFLFPPTFTLILGNEEFGCSEETLRHADYLINIPLQGRKNSLNVANAAAITIAEIRRQHSQKKVSA